MLVALERTPNPNCHPWPIGDAFGVPVTLLIDLGGEPAVQISSPDASRVLWRGPSGGTGTIIGATDPPWAVELWRWEVMPGETFGGDAHAPATREMVWVESGTLTLIVAGERHEVRAGQCARFPASRPHRYENAGRSARPAHHGRGHPADPGITAGIKNRGGLDLWPWPVSQSRAA